MKLLKANLRIHPYIAQRKKYPQRGDWTVLYPESGTNISIFSAEEQDKITESVLFDLNEINVKNLTMFIACTQNQL